MAGRMVSLRGEYWGPLDASTPQCDPFVFGLIATDGRLHKCLAGPNLAVRMTENVTVGDRIAVGGKLTPAGIEVHRLMREIDPGDLS